MDIVLRVAAVLLIGVIAWLWVEARRARRRVLQKLEDSPYAGRFDVRDHLEGAEQGVAAASALLARLLRESDRYEVSFTGDERDVEDIVGDLRFTLRSHLLQPMQGVFSGREDDLKAALHIIGTTPELGAVFDAQLAEVKRDWSEHVEIAKEIEEVRTKLKGERKDEGVNS